MAENSVSIGLARIKNLDLDKLVPGRDLDALVAEFVLGQEVWMVSEDYHRIQGEESTIPHFSTEKEAALSLMKQAEEKGFRMKLTESLGSDDKNVKRWFCDCNGIVAESKSLAFAVTIAAMRVAKAKYIKENSESASLPQSANTQDKG